MAISWTVLGQEQFARIVEALVQRIYAPSAEVIVPDGRGGDGGIDIQVRQGDNLIIFQLKYFPTGFPAESRSRRKQIKSSFKTAMEHHPSHWILVVPCNLTPGERRFVLELGKSSTVDISVMGRVELDSKMAQFPDLGNYFNRDDQLLDAARVYGQEKSILRGGISDLSSRVSALGMLVDSCDPNWTFDFARRGGAVVSTLRALHPNAHIVSPIHISVQSVFKPQHSALVDAMDRVFGYGTSETVTLPPEVVKNLTIQGPEWMSAQYEDVEVTWLPRPSVLSNAPIRLDILDAHNTHVRSFDGTATNAGSGDLGNSIEIDFFGVVRLTFVIPSDKGARGSFSYTIQTAECSVEDVIEGISLLVELFATGRADLHLNEALIYSAQGILKPSRNNSDMVDLDTLLAVAKDLVIVQRYCSRRFPFPKLLTVDDVIMLRAARLLIEGKCVAHPKMGALNAQVTGQDVTQLYRFLKEDATAVRVDLEEYGFFIDGRRMQLGLLSVFHTQVVLDDKDEIFRALEEGDIVGRTIVLRPRNSERFHAYIPSRWPDDALPLIPTPLGLPGL